MNRNKILPSEKISNELSELLMNGMNEKDSQEDLLGIILKKSLQKTVQELLEILSTGEKIMLHLSLGNRENCETWTEFFREMQNRGLRVPMLIISDGGPGLKKAIEDCFPESMR